MKRKLVSVLLSVSLVAAMVMGCSNGDGDKKSSSTKTESTSNKKGGHKFGYTCMDGTNPFFVTLEDEIRKKVEANGDELVSVDPANDVSLQVQQVEDLISQGIDAMFLNPAEAEGILPALDALKEANIPIVNFDTEVADMSYATSYVGSDNYNAQGEGEAPFVSVGDRVKKGQTLGIVEAMKLMHEITCEQNGIVKEICAQNGDAVEYGQKLFACGRPSR